MTDAELIAAGDHARAAGVSLSDFVRARLADGTVPARPALSTARLLSELNRCGVNLNQIARRLDHGQDASGDLGDVLAEFQRVLQLVGRAYGS